MIAVVGLLASVVIFGVNAAQARSRDAKRVSDFKEFSVALDVFVAQYGIYPCGDANTHDGMTFDSSGSYPFIDGTGGISVTNCIGTPTFGLYTIGLLSGAQLEDPLNTYGQLYWYKANGDRDLYILYVHLENDSEKMQNDGGLCPNLYEFGPGTGIIPPTDHVAGVQCN